MQLGPLSVLPAQGLLFGVRRSQPKDERQNAAISSGRNAGTSTTGEKDVEWCR